jgi:NADH-quinone oxidoreductase subunit F
LPRDVLNMEIDGIRNLGVDMKTNHFFSLGGNETSFRKLGFRAIFLSTGAHRSLKLNIPGENLRGVLPGVEFLRDVNLGKKIELGEKVVVIGGGNVAIDVARSARRLTVARVEIFCLESQKEMPAIREEVEGAKREGVKIHFQVSPIRMIGRAGRVIGAEFMRSGMMKGSTFGILSDTIIKAIGQRVDRNILRELDTNQDGTIRVNPETGETSIKGVFAGGDVVRGPGWAIDAIADGKNGAESIHQYLS